MARVKGGVTSNKTRKNILKQVKGYRFGRSTKKRPAMEAIVHAGKYSFAHRKDKKNDFRRLWTVRINGGLDTMGTTLSYSRLIDAMKKKGVLVNRKMLSELAGSRPEVFERIVKHVS
ncbi:MAG: rplT [Candidatus Adlerbacteria bacterium]|nr:rplT [Candidatus Adlerbacteria bacterium]